MTEKTKQTFLMLLILILLIIIAVSLDHYFGIKFYEYLKPTHPIIDAAMIGTGVGL